VTLIAAFRCQEGVVLCADQQETVGDVRVAVNKIAPQDCGNYQLAFAGSGNGDLIDGFADSLRLNMEQWQPQLDENVIRGNIRNLLLDFHENEVALYPANIKDDKLNHCLVCIKPKESEDIFLWELRGSVIVPVADYSLLGIGEAIYRHELKRLYRGRPRGFQAVLLGSHLFSLARETSNYVGGETDIIFVHRNGMTVESSEVVYELERHVAAFNRKMAELALACPDTSITDDEIKEKLSEFRDEAMLLRECFVNVAETEIIIRTIKQGLHGQDVPYLKIPPSAIPLLVETRKPRRLPDDEEEDVPDAPTDDLPSDFETSEGQP
jgi:20S proteasome alpha/beta subunit